MKLVSLTLKNFRCFKNETTVTFDDLTTIIGKNDIGKSTILEALEIFFNNELVSVDSGDVNVFSDSKEIEITCEFTDLPKKLTIDATLETTLESEYLLSKNNTLKIKKVYKCSYKKPTEEVFVIANHPSVQGYENLLELKEKDLQTKVKSLGMSGPLKGNHLMRKAIWQQASDLELLERPLPLSKSKEDGKKIWDKLQEYLPVYALFQSDRNSTDADSEVQSPLKAAVALALSDVSEDINKIEKAVQDRAEAIVQDTYKALVEIAPNLAKELTPQFTKATPSKWQGLFSVGLTTDSGIPLNKSGSGIRRMILVSFFKAQADKSSRNHKNIIYAVEEPETAQHPNNQKLLLNSFKSLASEECCQVILTTHSPGLASELDTSGIRFITKVPNSDTPVINSEIDDVFDQVAESLGVVPDSRIKALVCVEGITDVSALSDLSHTLFEQDHSLIDLSKDPRIAFVVLGGGNLKHWVNRHFLKDLHLPEIHIYDGDVKHTTEVQQINERQDGSWALQTKKHEIENYLHHDAIKQAFGVDVEVTDFPIDHNHSVGKLFAKEFSKKKMYDGTMKESNAKVKLAEKAYKFMTPELINDRDPEGEIRGWLQRIRETVE